MAFKFNALTGMLDLVGITSIPAGTVTSSSGSSIDNGIATFDGTSGSIIQDNSTATLDDSGNLTATSFIGSGTSLTGVELLSHKAVANGYPSLDVNALIPINQIPPAALERLVIVANQAARFALTTATVQNGDTVKQTDTNVMYFVIDDTNLNNSSGYAIYSAGTAVNFSGTLSGDITGGQSSTLVSSIQGTTVSGTTGSGNVVFSASPTITGTLTASTISASGNITGLNLSGTNTGDQTITLTGDVTGSGTGSFATTIANLAVTNAKIANATIDLTTKVTGVLPYTNGGTNASTSFTPGSVIFAGASSFSQDNSNAFYDATNHNLLLGSTTQAGSTRLAIKGTNSTTSGLGIYPFSGSEYWTLSASGNDLYLINPNSNRRIFDALNTGQIAWGTAAANGAANLDNFLVKNANGVGNTSTTFSVQKSTSQTGDLTDWYDTDGTTKLARIDVTGKGIFVNLQDTTLSTGVVHSDSSGNFTSSAVSLTTEVSGTLPITNGGTGQVTSSAAYNALSPMTTTGDLEYEVSAGTAARLPIGSTGQVLTVVAGAPAWSDASVSPGSIALTQNHILVGNASNIAADVAMSGDATIVSSGAVTFATVNGNVGSFGSSTSIPSFTVNAKGLVTAASGNVVIAPAGTLTGTTLNSTVVSSSLTSVGTITSGTWTGTTIAVANGGTGTTTSTGTGSVVLSSGPTMVNPIVGTQSQNDNSTKGASTAYVDLAISNAIAGVNPAVAVNAATTQASDTSGLTYNNGVSGIGATLTGSINTAITFDGYTFTALGQRGLVKNDTQSPSGAFNGVYYVTQVQTGILPPVLTRALDYDMPSDINNTGAIPVISGTMNADTSWLLTSLIATVGTDPLTYRIFTSKVSVGDISETSFTAADNQSSAANVTGLLFSNSIVRSADIMLSIVRNTTYAQYKLNVVQGASSWYIDQSYLGDVTGLVFTITSAGQVQYTSTSTGSTAALRFRALTTSV